MSLTRPGAAASTARRARSGQPIASAAPPPSACDRTGAGLDLDVVAGDDAKKRDVEVAKETLARELGVARLRREPLRAGERPMPVDSRRGVETPVRSRRGVEMGISTLVDPRRVAADAASIGAQRGGEPREGKRSETKKIGVPGAEIPQREGVADHPGVHPEIARRRRRFAAALHRDATLRRRRRRRRRQRPRARTLDRSRVRAVPGNRGGGRRAIARLGHRDHRASRSRRRLASFSASSLFSSKMTAKAFM